MCIAIPMRVLSVETGFARCADRDGSERRIDIALVDAVQPGDWLLAFHSVAREILSDARALEIRRALDALEAAMRGDLHDLDAAFPDLANREPQLPDFLR